MKRWLPLVVMVMLTNLVFAQYGSNLLTNPGAEDGDGFTGWTRTDGGSGWALNWNTPRTGSNCWSSSSSWCTLEQTVVLTDKGYSTAWLDTEPAILAGIYVSSRFDHVAQYDITVQLLNASDGVVDSWATGVVDLGQGVDWFLASNLFTSYGTGVRKVKFIFKGEDGSPSWGGQYGASFDDAALQINELTLSVSLTSVQVVQKGGDVLIKWITESEVDNAGFILERKAETGGDWQVLASYANEASLAGQGNSSERHSYQWLDEDAPVETDLLYRLSDVSTAGLRTMHAPISIRLEPLPAEPMLEKPYPNPFNPSTYIAYELPETADVEIAVFNLLGQPVNTLYAGVQEAGRFHVYWNGNWEDGRSAASGAYVIRLKTAGTLKYQKVIVTK